MLAVYIFGGHTPSPPVPNFIEIQGEVSR